MPEEIEDFDEVDDFEEVATPKIDIKNKTKNSSKKDNIIDFNKGKQELNSRNNKLSQNMPKQNIGEMPQTNPPSPSQNESNLSKRPGISPTNNDDKNKIKKNNNANESKKQEEKTPNRQKKDSNILPFNNRKDDKKDNSLRDKINKKRPSTQFGRKKKKEDDEDDDVKKDNKNENDSKNDKKEENSKDNKKDSKKGGLKSAINKIKNPVQSIKAGAKNVVKAAVDKVLKPIKIKIIMSISALVVGLSLCFVVIYLILSPLMDVWSSIDEAARGAANFTEKFLNFFKGFGFEDSKQAFYDEVTALDEFYDYNLDMPLLLSTIFYPEIQNYGMTYEEHVAIEDGDPILAGLTGGPSGFVEFITGWVKDITQEASSTLDENGLVYNANKIYRLRRLAYAMADTSSGEEKTVFVGEFLKNLKSKLAKALKNVFTSISGAILEIIGAAVSALINTTMDIVRGVLTFDFDTMANDLKEDFEKCIERVDASGQNAWLAIKQFIDIMSFGLCSITSISINVVSGVIQGNLEEAISVTYTPYTFNKEKYDNYLLNYYFENTYEYAKMLPGDSSARETRKKQILSEIYANKETFEQLFLDYKEGTGEEYVNNCEGAIPNKVVRNLSLPVNSSTFNFTQSDVFGVKNGYKQNGVLLTQSNSGITTGNEVYSVYDGTVLDMGVMNGNSASSEPSNKTYKLTEDEYKALASQCLAEQGTEAGIRYEMSQMLNLYEKRVSQNATSAKNVHDYIRDSSWYSCSKYHMDSSCTGSGCYCDKNGKYIVYKYTDSAVKIVKDVIENGNRSFPSYVTEHDYKNDIVKIENEGTVYTDRSSIENRSLYKKDVTKVYTKSTTADGKDDYWIFYSFPTSDSDAFGYYPSDKNKVISESTESSENNNFVTIKHEMILDNNTNQSTRETFYTTYEYLGSISSSLTVGGHVSKGQAIGTIGMVDSSSSSELVGDTTYERVWWALLGAGYSKEATAGIIGNMAVETSHGDIDKITANSLQNVKTFEEVMSSMTSGLGFGLNGWSHSSFKETFKVYLDTVGGNWNDEEVQIGYLIETLKKDNMWNRRLYNEYTNYTFDKFVNASTPEIAGEQFCRIYEKGPRYEYNPQRGKSARVVYDRMKDKVMPVSNISTTGVNKQPGFYFEFRNKDNNAINPNNLFIKCAGAYGDYIWPGSDGHISDLFGDRSYEVRNGLGNYGSCATTAHVALDINEKGAFYAIGSGTIDSISTSGVHTIEFKLDDTDMDGNEIYIVYTHGDAKKGLKKGQHLEQGEQIGTANGWGYNKQGVNTASAYGVHLHFGVYTKTSSGRLYHNPLTYLYNLSYDSSNDWKMSVNIPKYDGTILSEITFWNIRPEERNFAADFATVGNYNSNKCDYENPKFWKSTNIN